MASSEEDKEQNHSSSEDGIESSSEDGIESSLEEQIESSSNSRLGQFQAQN